MKTKIVAIGDLHFGSPRINSEAQYKRLRNYLYPQLTDAQLLLLTGDTYDQLTTVSSSAHRYVFMLICDLLVRARDTGLKIRILHGTFSHDRDQVSVFTKLATADVDFKVITEISCEELTGFNNGETHPLKIVYLPDNLPYKRSSQVIEHIKTVYQCAGWERADILLGHGTFRHALSCAVECLPACTFTAEEMKPLLEKNGIAIMGHIHIHSHYDYVYYCGSFDRKNHGEEEPKGYYVFKKDLASNDCWDADFIPNADATLFKTITPQGNTPEELVHSLLSQIKVLFPEGFGYVRVIYSEPELRGLYQNVVHQEYPNLVFSGKSIKDKDTNELKLDDVSLDVYEAEIPNANNLGELVYSFLEDNKDLGNLTKERLTSALQTLIG